MSEVLRTWIYKASQKISFLRHYRRLIIREVPLHPNNIFLTKFSIQQVKKFMCSDNSRSYIIQDTQCLPKFLILHS